MLIKKKSIILVHGLVEGSLLDQFKKKGAKSVFILESRPRLEGAKILSQELLKRKIKPVVIADNMAGFLFFKGLVKEVWIGCQACYKNGATCDIGSLILAVLAKRHKVAVNLVTSRRKTVSVGKSEEILYFNGTRVAPKGIKGYVPLVEWVPQVYITRIYQ
ncbi:MAG TPA: hypothetical protein PL155_07065 [Candidatus Omnitrophota bacterium]|nr:hypothetical protein [Candidatus Omnitrophota bacterium]HPD85530.1 hypothetical protein [Candidatus Omnitrophota bacterium]HRZ04430.1 hypothetical protein [Candidatus Omnitrophota bacterium]